MAEDFPSEFWRSTVVCLFPDTRHTQTYHHREILMFKSKLDHIDMLECLKIDASSWSIDNDFLDWATKNDNNSHRMIFALLAEIDSNKYHIADPEQQDSDVFLNAELNDGILESNLPKRFHHAIINACHDRDVFKFKGILWLFNLPIRRKKASDAEG